METRHNNKRVTPRRAAFRLGCAVAMLLSALVSRPAATERMPRAALQVAAQTGFDIAPHFQFGFALDIYLRLTRRFSLGWRTGVLNTVRPGVDPPVVPQIPLELLFSWDFRPSRRVLVPLTMGTGVSFLPVFSHELFVDMLTLECGAKIRLSRKVWLSIIGGGRALMHCRYGGDGWCRPHGDFRMLVGPYIRF
jgi:hypothetical protein